MIVFGKHWIEKNCFRNSDLDVKQKIIPKYDILIKKYYYNLKETLIWGDFIVGEPRSLFLVSSGIFDTFLSLLRIYGYILKKKNCPIIIFPALLMLIMTLCYSTDNDLWINLVLGSRLPMDNKDFLSEEYLWELLGWYLQSIKPCFYICC